MDDGYATLTRAGWSAWLSYQGGDPDSLHPGDAFSTRVPAVLVRSRFSGLASETLMVPDRWAPFLRRVGALCDVHPEDALLMADALVERLGEARTLAVYALGGPAVVETLLDAWGLLTSGRPLQPLEATP